MDTETVRWLSTLIIANVIAWSVLMFSVKSLLNRAKHTEEKSDELIDMHHNADENGFGTVALLAAVEHSEERRGRSSRELVHYMRWFVEKASGIKPPPFVDSGE